MIIIHNILVSGYQAEYGRASGVQVSAVTKSGSNQFRGSVYDVQRNSSWNANSQTNVLNGDPKTTVNEKDLGYSIGGPIGRGGGRGRGRGEMTPEQQAAQQEAAAKLKAWRTSVSMDPFKKLRRMYNDAGVGIYAWKQLNPNMSDEEVEYIFDVAEALGCTHTTLELPTDPAQLKRIGEIATKKKIYASYHTHLQGSMTAFAQAFALSKGNTANIDIGHYVAAGNPGGTPVQFFEKFHDRITSFHIKDRTTPEHCALNLPFGEGETPLQEVLHLLRKNKWRIPATIELEYQIPEGSDPVKEVRKSFEYCRKVLTTT
jgi:sugar phosphate isomerase/epimerase